MILTNNNFQTDQIKKIEEAKVAIKEAFALPDDAKGLQVVFSLIILNSPIFYLLKLTLM